MSWWDNLLGRKKVSYGSSAFVGQAVSWYKPDLLSYLIHGYKDNDVVYSAVNLVMDKARMAPWGLYEIQDESSLKSYNAILSRKEITAKDWNKAVEYREKALIPVKRPDSKTDQIKKLLQWANSQETFNDLVANTVGNHMIFGNAFWDGNNLDMGADEGIPDHIDNLPPQLVTILFNRGYPTTITKYKLEIEGYPEFIPQRIIHTRLWNPGGYDVQGKHLFGMSPLEAGKKILQRNNAVKYATVQAFENGGAIGVLYADDDRLTIDEGLAQIEAVKKKWDEDYRGQYGKVAHSGYKVGFQKITDTLENMRVAEIENLDMRRIFNLWGIPSQLANDPENRTYNTQKEAEKALTSRCAIPRLVSIRDSLNYRLGGDWGKLDKKYYADFDGTVYDELQEDVGKKWEHVKQLPISSRSKLETMGMDADENPLLDEILIPTGYVRLQDVAEGIDTTLSEYDAKPED